MIAADTSTWIVFFSRAEGEDVGRLDEALQDRVVMMPPPVLSELLSDPKLSADLQATLCEVPLLDTSDGYWARQPAARYRPRQTQENPSGRRPHCAELPRSPPAAPHARPRLQGLRRRGRARPRRRPLVT